MNSKGKALHNFTEKKNEIRERLSAYKEVETPRSKQIRETNERVAKQGLAMTARARHERRHGSGYRTSKAEALERAKKFSKER